MFCDIGAESIEAWYAIRLDHKVFVRSAFSECVCTVVLAPYIAIKMTLKLQEGRDHVCDVNTISPVIVAHLTDVCPHTFTGRHL
jgi:hypothetical protein